MVKKITLAQVEKALQLTYDVGIDIQGGLIFGDAEETKESVASSLKWYDERRHYALDLNMIHIFPGTVLYKNALVRGILKDPVKFLTDGCPLINVSRLTDREYRDLSSNLYERNMRAKYEPRQYQVNDIKADGSCTTSVTCNRCEHTFTVPSDALHIQRLSCAKCRQRYYVDPFKKLHLPATLPDNDFSHDDHVVLWGAGELCIKLLDHYPVLQNEKFTVVDSSKSRQGYSVCGKPILTPEFINEHRVKTVILTVVRRKAEILRQLAAFPGIENIYLPAVAVTDAAPAAFVLERIPAFTPSTPAPLTTGTPA
jgi:hypothetical protein